MKIKTITCHDVYNAGASLQAYALSEYLTSLGHDVQIIDYKPDYLSHHYTLTYVGSSKFNKPFLKQLYILAKFPERLIARLGKRKREYDKFTSILPLTKKSYSSNSELKTDPPLADVYFAGSDQIWNTLFHNGKDPAFYLDFAPKNSIKASYAASFATEDIANDCKSQVERWISALDFISVRETTGLNIIKSFGIDRAVSVLDPVFLLDEEKWQQVAKPLNLKTPYILLYAFNGSEEFKSFVLKKARNEGLKIYSIFKCDFADKCFYKMGPAAFLTLIKNARFIVSNSFHATAFSIIFKKQFAVFERCESINSRMKDLLSISGLDNRLIANSSQSLEDIDYRLVSPKLNEEILKSKNFINDVLKK